MPTDWRQTLRLSLREAKASIEETNVVDAYSRLVQLQTNFDAAMQVTSMQRYSGLFTKDLIVRVRSLCWIEAAFKRFAF